MVGKAPKNGRRYRKDKIQKEKRPPAVKSKNCFLSNECLTFQIIIIFYTGCKQKGTILSITEHGRVNERNGKFCFLLCDIYQQINF